MSKSSLNDDRSFILGLAISFTCLLLCNQFLICFMRLGFHVQVFLRLLFDYVRASVDARLGLLYSRGDVIFIFFSLHTEVMSGGGRISPT